MERELFFDLALPLWGAFTLAGLFTAVTVWTYFQMDREVSFPKKAIFIGLRLAALLIILFCIVRPVSRQAQWKQNPNHLVFVRDVSQSMDLVDVGGMSRIEAVERLEDQTRDIYSDLENRFEVHHFDFAGGLNPDQNSGGTTAIGDSLDEVAKKVPANALLGVVVLTDGQNNAGQSPLTLAGRWGDRGIPIYPVAFGRDREGKDLFDIQAQNIHGEKEVYVGHEVPMFGEFVFRGLKGKAVQVHLKINGKKVTSQKVKVTAQLLTKRVTFTYKFPGQGLYKVTLEAEPIKGEASVKNNAITTFIRTTTKKLYILYIEGYPRWELKFLRRALGEDKNITLNVMFTSGGRFQPPANFEWKKFHAVILGDVPPRYFTSKQMSELHTAVFDHGRGLLLLGGRFNFRNSRYTQSRLGPCFPFRDSMARYEQEQFELRRRESAKKHFALRLSKSEQANENLWKQVPKMVGLVKGIRLKAGAEVLLEDEQKNPLLITQPNAGLGRTATMLAANTWQWVMGSDKGRELHQRFWSNLVLWLAKREKNNREQLWIELEKHRYLKGKKIEVQAYLRNKRGRNVEGARVLGELVHTDGSRQILQFAWFKGRYRTFVRPKKTGEYKLMVEGQKGGKQVGKAENRFVVYQKNLEMNRVAADVIAMRQMANLSGGRFLTAKDYPSFLESLLQKPSAAKVKVKEVDAPAVNHTFLFLAFLLFLSGEWYFRRQSGLQ